MIKQSLTTKYKRLFFGLTVCFYIVVDAQFVRAQTPNDVQRPIDSIACRINSSILQTNLKLADELFISGNDSLASLRYREALDRLNYYSLSLGCDDENFYRFCRANIEYRLLLLENGMDFWGISYNMTPLNPIEHYKKFTTLKAAFDKQFNDMNSLIGQIGKAGDVISEDRSRLELNNTEIAVRGYEQNKEEIKINYYNENIQLTRHKIEMMNQRQQEIEQEAVSTMKKVNQLTAGLTNIMLNAICQSVGLPVNLSELNLNASLKDNLLKTGSQLILNNPEVKKNLSELSATADKLIDIYQTADSLKDKVNSVRQAAREIYDLVHKPSWDKMISIGFKLGAEIDPEQMKQIKQTFDRYKSVASLVHLAENFPDLKILLAQRFLKETAAVNELLSIWETEKQAFSDWFLLTVEKIMAANASAEAKIKAVQVLVNNAAESFVDALTEQAREEWKKLTGKSSIQELKEWLKTASVARLSQFIRLEQDQLVFIQSQVKMNLSDILKQLQAMKGSVTIEFNDSVRDFAKQAFENKLPEISEIVVKNISLQWINEASAAVFKNKTVEQVRAQSAAIYDEVLQKVRSATDIGRELQNQIDAFNLGSFFVSNQGGTETPVMTPASTSTGMSKGDMLKQAALTAGIAAACPYVAIAGQFIANWIQRGKLLDKLEKLENEQKEITIQKLHAYDLLHELIVNERIAQLDKQIAEERQHYARQMFDLYKTKMRANTRNITIVRMQLNSRKALLYYLSEKLREQYALINKALLYRHGQTLYEKITSSPDNLRYALDEDITLFQWLDNNIQASRADIDRLHVYWDQVQTLIEANCDECKEGFAPSVTVLETDPISIKTIYPEEWQNFKKAISTQKEYYDFILPILPGHPVLIPQEYQKLKLRILAVRMGGLGPQSNRYARLTSAELFHTGVSYLNTANQFKKEVFQPQMRTAIEPGNRPTDGNLSYWPQPFQLDDLQQRWRTQGGNPALPLEGYGFYSIYRLRVPISASSKDLQDIFLRFACSFEPAKKQYPADDRRLVFNSGAQGNINFNNNDLAPIAGKDDWIKRVTLLLTDLNILLPNERNKKFEVVEINKESK